MYVRHFQAMKFCAKLLIFAVQQRGKSLISSPMLGGSGRSLLENLAVSSRLCGGLDKVNPFGSARRRPVTRCRKVLHLIAAIALFLGAQVLPAVAQDWGALATISSTMGVGGDKICLGEASRGDIGCPAYAPTVSSTGNLILTSGLTVDTVSLTTGTTTWGYLGSAASYLPNLASNGISATNISVTTINGVSVSALGGSGGGASVYDSGWFSATIATQYNHNHGLGAVPDVVQIYWSNTADGSGDVTMVGNNNYSGPTAQVNHVDATSVGVYSGRSYMTYLVKQNGGYSAPTTGYLRIIAYKAGGGGSGGTGVSAMSSLTDVTLTSPVSNSILVYDGSKWVNRFLQDAISATTMMQDWPDAIMCEASSQKIILTHATQVKSNNTHIYRFPANSSTDYYVIFAATGAYSTQSGLNTYDCVSSAKSISTLYAEGRAFNFIGGSGNTALGDHLISGTFAVTANGTSSIVSLSTAGTTWGYFGNNASYIPNLASNAISTTNISTTTINGIPVSALGGGGATSTMVTNWPDAITCNLTNPSAWGNVIFYLRQAPRADGKFFYAMAYNDNTVAFNADGSFSSYGGSVVASDCNKSISQLTADGKTFNLVGGSGASSSGGSGVVALSGTSANVTGIPSGVRKITLTFYQVTVSAGGGVLLRLGPASGYVSAGYLNSGSGQSTTGTGANNSTNGFSLLSAGSWVGPMSGIVHLNRMTGTNRWIISGQVTQGSTSGGFMNTAGSVELADPLERLQLVHASGTPTFSGSFEVDWQF